MDLLTLAEAAAMTRKRKPPCCCYRHEGRGLDVAFSAAILRHALTALRGSRAGSSDASLAPRGQQDHLLDGCRSDDFVIGANPKQRLVRRQVMVDLQAIPVRRPERNPMEKNISRRVEEDGGVNTVVRRRLAAYTAANEQPADTMVVGGARCGRGLRLNVV